MVGSSQSTFKLWRAVVQGNLISGEEVSSTSALLLDDLFLQVPHDAAMLPFEGLSLKDPLGLDLADGFGTGGLSFLDHTASGCLGLSLASLIDLAALDLLGQRATPSSHTALCLQASMDALVDRKSTRALLAIAQSSSSSTREVMLLVLETAVIGEMLAGMSSREASATSVLT